MSWDVGGTRTEGRVFWENQPQSLTTYSLVHSLRVCVCGLLAVHELPGAESASLQGRPNKTEDFRYVSKDAFGQPGSSENAVLLPNDGGWVTKSMDFLECKGNSRVDLVTF